MEESKIFKYSKCFCCNKNYKSSSLIELHSNSLEIAEENLNFADLLVDCCFIRMDDSKTSYICEGCKEQLIMFHMFKRDVKKYNSFQEHIKKMEVLLKIDELLTKLSDIDDLSVYQHDNTILITKNTDEMEHESLVQTEQNCLIEDEGMVIEEIPMKCNIEEEYIEEMQDEDYINDVPENLGVKTEEYSYRDELNDSYNSSEGGSQAKRRKKYFYKINTNESLSTEQIAWVKQQVSKSVVVIGGKKVFKCQLCGTILQIAGSLKKHLRDSHLLKTQDEEHEREFKRSFNDEINRSKVYIETSSGTETIWKCQRCPENRIFRSVSGLKVHLRYNHIKGQTIDAEFVANCKITIECGDQIKNAWQCPECSKILKSRDGLRNHMKLEHADLVEKLQTTTSTEGIAKNIKVESSRMSSESGNETFMKPEKKEIKIPQKFTNHVVCEPCGLQFINGSTKREKSFEIHQQLHKILKIVSQSYELPKCEQCKVMFSNNEDLANHSKSHDPEEVFVAEGLSFLVATKYKNSIGTANDDDFEKWKCGHCVNIRFKDEIDCIEHQMILHSKQMICPIDYLEFNGVRGLSQFSTHMRNKHSEMFPELIICCSYCNQEFTNVFDKLAHMKNCDSKKFACDHCSKKFFTKTQLLRHLKIISGAISFTCDVCFKKCVSAMDLKLHHRSHTNERTYECSFPQCKKVFKTSGHRSSHMEIHSFIEYECSDCKAIFKQRALLQRHLKNAKCKGVQPTTLLL